METGASVLLYVYKPGKDPGERLEEDVDEEVEDEKVGVIVDCTGHVATWDLYFPSVRKIGDLWMKLEFKTAPCFQKDLVEAAVQIVSQFLHSWFIPKDHYAFLSAEEEQYLESMIWATATFFQIRWVVPSLAHNNLGQRVQSDVETEVGYRFSAWKGQR